MKRYVKEIYNDMKSQLLKLGCERKQEYLDSQLKMDRILTMAERGELTDKEAVSAIITCYDQEYYGYWE